MADRRRADGTSYLPARRTGAAALAEEIARAASSPLVTTLLRTTAAALAVVDANRQLVALNPAWLTLAGVASPEAVLGARPGEALGCTFASTSPGGCGTCAACASCGAAAALLVAGHRAGAAERDCALEARRDGKVETRALRVRASPLPLDGERFVLLALTDVTEARRREEVERAFVHDLANLACGLSGVAAELEPGIPAEPRVVEDVLALSGQLVRELRLHRALVEDRPEGFRPLLAQCAAAELVRLVHAAAAHGPAAEGRGVEVLPVPAVELSTDPLLVQHVLLNMVVNALEASRPGEAVRVAVGVEGDEVALRVWNRAPVPAAVQPRIFQRHFTTKPGSGRGLGTAAMKLYGERLLGGRVTFTTTAADGTWFELRLRRDGARLVP